MTYTILSLELNRTLNDTQCEKMHEVFGTLNWKNQPVTTAVWLKAWTDGHPANAYLDSAKKDISTVAEAMGLIDYDATVVVSNSPPVTWSLRPDELSAFERFLAAESLAINCVPSRGLSSHNHAQATLGS